MTPFATANAILIGLDDDGRRSRRWSRKMRRREQGQERLPAVVGWEEQRRMGVIPSSAGLRDHHRLPALQIAPGRPAARSARQRSGHGGHHRQSRAETAGEAGRSELLAAVAFWGRGEDNGGRLGSVTTAKTEWRAIRRGARPVARHRLLHIRLRIELYNLHPKLPTCLSLPVPLPMPGPRSLPPKHGEPPSPRSWLPAS